MFGFKFGEVIEYLLGGPAVCHHGDDGPDGHTKVTDDRYAPIFPGSTLVRSYAIQEAYPPDVTPRLVQGTQPPQGDEAALHVRNDRSGRRSSSSASAADCSHRARSADELRSARSEPDPGGAEDPADREHRQSAEEDNGDQDRARVHAFLEPAKEPGEVVDFVARVELLTSAQIAHRLGMSRSTVLRRIADGDIRVTKVGSHHRVPLTEYERYSRELMRRMVEASAADIKAEQFGE